MTRAFLDPCRLTLLILAGWMMCAKPLGAAPSRQTGLCPPEPRVTFTAGFGQTFRFWYLLDSSVVPVTVTWRCDRYELGLFSFGAQYQRIEGRRQEVARSDVAVSLTRRWSLHRWQDAGWFFGLGGSFRARAGPPEGNPFNGSHLNFTEQMGVRWWPAGHRLGLEISIRHFSNLGIVRPNVGQNFVDLAVVF